MSTVVVFGAGGRSGRACTLELLDAGHQVVAAVRDTSRLSHPLDPRASVVTADAFDAESVAEAAGGCDAAINAVRLPGSIRADRLVTLDSSLRRGLADARVARLVTVGGAGALHLSSGERFWQHPLFPVRTLPRGIAHALLRDHLESGQPDSLSWSYLVPPPLFAPDGTRTGSYLSHPPGVAEEAHLDRSVSYADFAIALSDSAVHPGPGGVTLVSGPSGR